MIQGRDPGKLREGSVIATPVGTQPSRGGCLRRILRLGRRGVGILLLVVVGWNGLRMARRPGPEEHRAALRFIERSLAEGAAEQMQGLFPEGYFFTHVLHGLSWLQVAASTPALRREALTGARRSLAAIDGPAGRAPFHGLQSPAGGVFYAGWRLLLLASLLEAEDVERRTEAELASLRAARADLATAFAGALEQDRLFLEAYPGQAWPCDSVVAVAALVRCLRVLGERSELPADWVRRVQAEVDPTTGLLPHRIDPASGAMLEGARGSSQALIQRFLPELDARWAAEQWSLFRAQFVSSRLGLPGVQEYPRGREGRGDVDSGPLILGISASATVVARGAAGVHGDDSLADALGRVMELLGLPITLDGERLYGGGFLPVGDAFVLWSQTAPRHADVQSPLGIVAPGWWLPSQLLPLVLVLLVWSPELVAWRRRRAAPVPRGEPGAR